MDDIELKNIQLQFPISRRFSGDGGCVEVRVRTDRGDILVAVQGDRSKPAIFTYHDIGLNCKFLYFRFFSVSLFRFILADIWWTADTGYIWWFSKLLIDFLFSSGRPRLLILFTDHPVH